MTSPTEPTETAAHDRLVVAAVVVAAGSGTRLAAPVPKAFYRVGGRTLLEHARARFEGHPLVRDVVAVVPAGHERATGGVAGGATRQESVSRGLAALATDVSAVLIHDAARPFVPAEVISRVIAALQDGADAAIPVLPVTDTIKRISGDGTVLDTLDRAELVAVQTPQGFRRPVLERAHAVAPAGAATDDAALVEALGARVVAVVGADEAFKITRPWDLRIAEAFLT